MSLNVPWNNGLLSSMTHWSRPLLIGAVAVLICTTSTGCLRRRITIRSNPPGAVVYVDQQPVGVTPVSASVTYYGTRRIQLMKDGFEPVDELHTFHPPWYEFPPIDFVSENLWPREIRDEREVSFQMVPRQVIPPQTVHERGEQLRGNAQQGMVTPLPGR